MRGPAVSIDLGIIARNARAVVTACGAGGIGVFGVTKATCGMPEVARAMLAGGVAGIAESRLDNIRRLRAAGVNATMMLLRVPALAQADEVVALADISLNSEVAVVAALSQAALRAGVIHRVVLMVDLGDLREGLWPDALMPAVAAVLRMPGVGLAGIGANLNCLGGVLPSAANMRQLLGFADAIRRRHGLSLPVISAGNSGALPLLLAGGMPHGITQLRIGEAILQGGRDTFFDQPWAALERGAFTLSAQLLEIKTKPSVPVGERGVDAFGQRPVFEDQGLRVRGILDLGLQDIELGSLHPADAALRVVGASSDHLVVDLTDAALPPQVGDRLDFSMGYGALLRAMTSPYVAKLVKK